MLIGIYDPYLDTLGGGEKYMLTAAAHFSTNHEVQIFWNTEQENHIKKTAKDRFELDLTRVKFVKNVFTQEVSFFERIKTTRKFDIIFFLSDGSIPMLFSKKTFLHMQFPTEWIGKPNIKTKLKLAKVNKIICNSQFTKAYIDRKFSTESTVVYPPLYSANDYPRATKKEKVILTVGRLGFLPNGSNFKKHDVMIDMFKKIVDQGNKDWRFVLVISYKKADEEKIHVLEGLSKNYPITIMKNISQQTLASLYNRASVYWHAAGYGEDVQKHPERAEHFGIATVEAMAHGAIPVVYNAGGQSEIIQNNRNGFLWNTEAELLTYTRDVMSMNSSNKKQIEKHAITTAKEFTLEHFCKKLESIFYG